MSTESAHAVSFEIKNNSNIPISKAQYNVLVKNGIFSQDKGNQCGNTLLPGQSCIISGNVKPYLEGPVVASLDYQYNEGVNVTLTTKSTAAIAQK